MDLKHNSVHSILETDDCGFQFQKLAVTKLCVYALLPMESTSTFALLIVLIKKLELDAVAVMIGFMITSTQISLVEKEQKQYFFSVSQVLSDEKKFHWKGLKR